MGIFKNLLETKSTLVEVADFGGSLDAKEHFADKYGFVGEQLQKLCSDTGLLVVEAEVDTGAWFLKSGYKGSYEKHDSVRIKATARKWWVNL